MHVRASIHYDYHRPSKCDLRVYLRGRGESEEPKTPYEQVIDRLGDRHEKSLLGAHADAVDLSDGSNAERIARTRDLLSSRVAVLYHPLLTADLRFDGVDCTVVGEPDFLVAANSGYLVRDAKIARRITEADHPEILRQVELYGWLLEQTTGVSPEALEVFAGMCEIVPIEYDGGARTLADLQRLVMIRQAATEPPAAVGWTSCGTCCFHGRCWNEAEATRDVALLPGVDRSLALALYQVGVHSFDDLVANFTPETLAEFKRPWGKRMQKVGTTSTKIFRAAEAMISNQMIVLAKPALPVAANYVMFDCEGLPPELKELDKVYLWGLQVFGQNQGPYFGVTADFGDDGDQRGWEAFLETADQILSEYGDVPFIHWHTYERTKLSVYIDRYGDPRGVAAHVKSLLVDLLPVAQAAVVLPLPSYSLKVVEKYVGFKRTLPEANGNWSMAAFVEATESGEGAVRDALMDNIRQYNCEDLQAAWGVMNWLRSLGPAH